MSDERLAQQIRENSQELRELESQLRAAYVNKALRAQLAEKEKNSLEEQLRQQNEYEIVRKHQQAEAEHDAKQKLNIKATQIKHRKELEKQIVDQRYEQRLLYDEFLKEKIIIDEILRRIEKEQIEELRERAIKSKHFREDIERLKSDQEAWKVEQERLDQEENSRIIRFMHDREEKLKQIKESYITKRKAETERQNEMCAQLNQLEKNKMERQELLVDLQCEELRDKQRIRDRAELEQKIRSNLLARMQLDEQMYDIELRKLQQQDDDKQYRLEQLRILADNDQLELLSNEKKRLKKLEHHRSVRQMLEEREAKRNLEIFDMMKEHENCIEQERRRQQIFEQERIKLLKKHADELIGFLPPGLLREFQGLRLK